MITCDQLYYLFSGSHSSEKIYLNCNSIIVDLQSMDIETLLATIEQQERDITQLEQELEQLQSPGANLDSSEKVSG